MLLEGKRAVIYGAGGAVGGAVSRAFAREGATVFLTGRTAAKVEALARDINASGGKAEAAEVDAMNERSVDTHLDAVASRAGGIDVSFNAIGIDDIRLGTLIVDMSVDDFTRPIARMMQAQFVTARAAARHMTRQGSGVILTITSPHGRQPVSNFGPVGAMQAAIEGLWRQLASELGPKGVRVVCVRSAGSPDAPGLDAVGDMMARTAGISRDEMEAAATQGMALRRFPMLAEVASVAALMASDRTSAMTGTVANVTCGGTVD